MRTTKFQNTDISASLKFYTNAGKLRGFLYAGPEANIIFKWREDIKRTPISTSEEGFLSRYEPKGGLNWLAFSLQGGAGLSFQLNDKLDLEARFFTKRNLTPSREVGGIADKLYYNAGTIGVMVNL